VLRIVISGVLPDTDDVDVMDDDDEVWEDCSVVVEETAPPFAEEDMEMFELLVEAVLGKDVEGGDEDELEEKLEDCSGTIAALATTEELEEFEGLEVLEELEELEESVVLEELEELEELEGLEEVVKLEEPEELEELDFEDVRVVKKLVDWLSDEVKEELD
jgi:hypothetical protein